LIEANKTLAVYEKNKKMNQDQEKKKLLKEYLIENMQRSLEEMPLEVAKQIIDSMTEKEIYVRVSKRQMQEDYIADYINFLWDVSRDSFWKHVSATFDIKEGLLWGGDMLYIEKICDNEIPSNILEKIIEFWINYRTVFPGQYEQDIDGLACILKAQCIRFNRKAEILAYIGIKYPQDLASYQEQLDLFINKDCHYTFYY
jgi:hypothetical protein